VLEVNGAIAYATYEPTCKRIFCAEFNLHNRREQLPKLDQNDLLITLKGSGEAHYTFFVDTIDESEFTLPDGFVFYTRMTDG
jgi:hypothetical protein